MPAGHACLPAVFSVCCPSLPTCLTPPPLLPLPFPPLITATRPQLHHEGDLTIRLFGLNDRATKFILRQPAKSLIDFKTVAKKQGPFRPHGIAIY